MSVTAHERVMDKVMKKSMMLGKRSNNVALMFLAVRFTFNAFDKVKKTMGDMLAELKGQQKNAYDQNKRRNEGIDETEGTVEFEQRNNKDLEERDKDLSNTLAILNDEIKTLK